MFVYANRILYDTSCIASDSIGLNYVALHCIGRSEVSKMSLEQHSIYGVLIVDRG